MANNPIEKTLLHLMAASLAMRDVLIVLLANEAARASDPDEAIKRISNSLNQNINGSENAPEVEGQLELVEGMRIQLDSIIGAAHALVAADSNLNATARRAVRRP